MTSDQSETSQERADDEHSSKGQRLVQEEQEALLRGDALGDGINLFGVSASRDTAAVAAAAADRREASAAIQLTATKSSSWSRNLDEEAGVPAYGNGLRKRDEMEPPSGSLSRIDDLFGNLGGRQDRIHQDRDEGTGEQRLLPANAKSSSSFSWNLR